MKKLQDYLDSRGLKYNKFALKCGITPAFITKLLKYGQIPSLKIAFQIEKQTNGEISIYDWVEEAQKIGKITQQKEQSKNTNTSRSKK